MTYPCMPLSSRQVSRMKPITLSLILCGTSFCIPWPLGATSDAQDSTHTIMHVYGDYHTPWSHACADSFNFHFGVDFDFSDPRGDSESENVWAVESGILTLVDETIHQLGNGTSISEWTIVLCEDSLSESGWCYQHVEPLPSDSFVQGQTTFSFPEQIGTMAELQDVSAKHLHFMRSLAEYSGFEPGLLNPLTVFDPSPADSAGLFTWTIYQEPDSAFFFLPDAEAVDSVNQQTGGWLAQWPTAQSAGDSMFTDEYDSDGIVDVFGDVDAFGYVFSVGEGQTGGNPQQVVMPARVSWSVVLDGPGSNDSTVFSRYLYDFEDVELGGSSDWEQYKQLYFCHQPESLFALPGRTYCLTNCGTTSIWNGISNIMENCLQTTAAAIGGGESFHPLNQVISDGLYRLEVFTYAFGASSPEPVVEIPFSVVNTREIAQRVVLTDAATRS